MAADSDPSVRLDLMKLATELVENRFVNRQDYLQNESLLEGGTGVTEPVEYDRFAEVERITNGLFKLYQTNGGKEMLDAIQQAYEMADQKYQTELSRLRFNAIKTDPTGTEVLSRVSYDMPVDNREQDIYNVANQMHSVLVAGGEGDLKVTIQAVEFGETVERQQDIIPEEIPPVEVKHLAF